MQVAEDFSLSFEMTIVINKLITPAVVLQKTAAGYVV